MQRDLKIKNEDLTEKNAQLDDVEAANQEVDKLKLISEELFEKGKRFKEEMSKHQREDKAPNYGGRYDRVGCNST